MFNDLRKESTEILNELKFDGYALGGLSVGKNHEENDKAVKETTIHEYPKTKIYHGCRRPVDILYSVENGIDMFDCVLPTRFGRNGRAFTDHGEINLRNAKYAQDKSPLDETINCYASINFSKSYLHHLTKVMKFYHQ